MLRRRPPWKLSRSSWVAGLGVLLGALALLFFASEAAGRARAATVAGQVYMPLVARGPTGGPPDLDEEYDTLDVDGEPETRPAAEHPDLNLAVRGYQAVDAYAGLVSYGGVTDPHAPQFVGLLGRGPQIRGTYQVSGWDWGDMARTGPITTPPVTLITLAAERYEIVRVPDSGRTIGDNYQVLALYADTDRITLKYTREDNVVEGYTLHLERVGVAPDLLDLYREANAAGRDRLPALRAGQALGWAAGDTIGIAIRDAGTFLDPRSGKDWWQGF